jgi:hypothetical protein
VFKVPFPRTVGEYVFPVAEGAPSPNGGIQAALPLANGNRTWRAFFSREKCLALRTSPPMNYGLDFFGDGAAVYTPNVSYAAGAGTALYEVVFRIGQMDDLSGDAMVSYQLSIWRASDTNTNSVDVYAVRGAFALLSNRSQTEWQQISFTNNGQQGSPVPMGNPITVIGMAAKSDVTKGAAGRSILLSFTDTQSSACTNPPCSVVLVPAQPSPVLSGAWRGNAGGVTVALQLGADGGRRTYRAQVTYPAGTYVQRSSIPCEMSGHYAVFGNDQGSANRFRVSFSVFTSQCVAWMGFQPSELHHIGDNMTFGLQVVVQLGGAPVVVPMFWAA